MVSVIIPAYNVAPYLTRCLDSVFCQSCQDIEIILIDDGSTDETPALCDDLASRDARIRVVHKKNGGLSSARNAGIEAAKGEWLMFVDSDDWLQPECIKLLLSDVLTYDVKMAMAGHKRTSTPDDQEDPHHADTPEVVDRDTAIPRMLHGEWISAWAKLYHRSLWENVRFPEGLNNEDYAILIQVFEQCERVTYRKDVVYYYYIHEGSICRSKTNPHTFDEFQTGQMVLSYCQEHHPQWEHLALFNLTASIIKLTGECIVNGQYMDRYEQMRDYYCTHKSAILGNPVLGMQYKSFLWCLGCNRIMHKLFVKAYNAWKR